MLIPMRCVTCGKILADKWDYYQKEVSTRKKKEGIKESTKLINVSNISTITKTIEGNVLDELGLERICCRRHMLTHVDLTF